MRTRPLTPARCLPLALALGAACATTDPQDDEPLDSGSTDDTGEDTALIEAECVLEAASDDPDCSSDVPSGGASLTGTVTLLGGEGIGDEAVRVQYCRGETCLVPDCVQGSAFSFGGLDAGPGSFDIITLEPCDGERLAVPFVPLTLEADGSRTVDVKVPRLEAGIALPATATEVEVVDGLYLTVADGELDRPTPLDPVATEVAGVAVAEADRLPVEGIDGTVLAMWYLAPFDYTSDEGIPVRIDDAWSVGSGNAELWLGDYETSAWVKVGDLTEDGDGKLTPGATLSKVSTLVVVEKPAAD